LFLRKNDFVNWKISVVKYSFTTQIHPTYLAHFALLQIVPCCCGTRRTSRRKIANLCALI